MSDIPDLLETEQPRAIHIADIDGITATQHHLGGILLPPSWGSIDQIDDPEAWIVMDECPLYHNNSNGTYTPAPSRYLHGAYWRGKLHLRITDIAFPEPPPPPDHTIPDLMEGEPGILRAELDGPTASDVSPGTYRGCTLVPGDLYERDTYLRHNGQWRGDLPWIMADTWTLPWYNPDGYTGQNGVTYCLWACITCGRLFLVLQHAVEGFGKVCELMDGPWDADGTQPWHPLGGEHIGIPDLDQTLPATAIHIADIDGIASTQHYSGEHIILPAFAPSAVATYDTVILRWQAIDPRHTITTTASLDPLTWTYALHTSVDYTG